MFLKREQNIEKMLERYFERCDECYDCFKDAFNVYFSEGHGDAFEGAVNTVHKAESRCDDLRREIEYLLYGKALLPESRGDVLGLLETYDKLPNIAETVCFVMSCQKTVLPQELHGAYRELLETNIDAYRLARRAVESLMTNPRAVLHATKDVEHRESDSDNLERKLIRAIFERNDTTGDKMLYKEIVLLIGEISDRAEKVADRVAITAIKRQI